MTESRMQRWARKKAESRQASQPTVTEPAKVTETVQEANPIEQELAINQDLSEQELLAKYNLPNPDNLEQGTDITGFLRKEIPEFLRRKALRSLWRSNPVFSVLDGLNEYDEDFSKVTTPLGGVKTAYKVGKGGFLDLEKRERERQQEALEPTDDTVRVSETEPAASAAQELRQEEAEAETPEDSPDREGVETAAQPTMEEPEAEPERRFRPRMQFES